MEKTIFCDLQTKENGYYYFCHRLDLDGNFLCSYQKEDGSYEHCEHSIPNGRKVSITCT